MTQSVTIAIGETQIRQLDGLYSLNDLHKASGGERQHQPSNFIRLDQTQALIAEIDKSSEVRISHKMQRGAHGGTYVCKELVYAYANWISPAFYLRMIRAFDAMRGEPAGHQRQLPFTPHNPHLLPPQQAEEIKARLNRLAALFHPFSDQYLDVLGILRCLRGNHPRLGMKEAGYRQVIEAHRP